MVLSAVFSYALLNVIFVPIKETALSPVKTYRISGLTPTDLVDNTNFPAWRVTYVRTNFTLSIILQLYYASNVLIFNTQITLATICSATCYGGHEPYLLNTLGFVLLSR